MDIQEFVQRSIGQWRSQRSAHHLAFSHFEAIESVIEIVALSCEDPSVIDLCKTYDIDAQKAVSPFRISWEGQSDWDEGAEVLKGASILVPVPDPVQPNRGKLLRDQGYAETMAAATITNNSLYCSSSLDVHNFLTFKLQLKSKEVMHNPQPQRYLLLLI